MVHFSKRIYTAVCSCAFSKSIDPLDLSGKAHLSISEIVFLTIQAVLLQDTWHPWKSHQCFKIHSYCYFYNSPVTVIPSNFFLPRVQACNFTGVLWVRPVCPQWLFPFCQMVKSWYLSQHNAKSKWRGQCAASHCPRGMLLQTDLIAALLHPWSLTCQPLLVIVIDTF